ncbi:hypothetical protein YC2023_039875 [Brassica napus]
MKGRFAKKKITNEILTNPSWSCKRSATERILYPFQISSQSNDRQLLIYLVAKKIYCSEVQPGRKGKTERQSPEGYIRYTGPSQSAHKEERKGAATAQQIIVGFGDTTIRKKAALPRNNRRIEKAARNTDTTKEREADKGRIPTTIDKRQFHYGGIPTSCSGTSSSNRSIPLESLQPLAPELRNLVSREMLAQEGELSSEASAHISIQDF